MNHIELFAGCGGLSLGLKAAGFELMLANELSPMAAESFAYNLLLEDLAELAALEKQPKKTFWLSSKHTQLALRLRENPFTYPELNSPDNVSLLPSDTSDLKGKLLVGSIIELNKLLDSNESLIQHLSNSFGRGDVDLVSGGPPCQSFSLAGLRKKDCEKNTLPWEFVKFVSRVKPKAVLLENVTGILHAFKDSDGVKFHAWFEVAKAFATVGYVPLCLHLNARSVGIPQNRPRFIMLAFREECFFKIYDKVKDNSSERELLSSSENFFRLVQEDVEKVELGSLTCFDTGISNHRELFKNSFLRTLIGEREVSADEAIGDLKRFTFAQPSQYVKKLNATFCKKLPERTGVFNHTFRNHNKTVKSRFKIYQIAQQTSDMQVYKELSAILKGAQDTLSELVWEKLKQTNFSIDRDSPLIFENKQQLDEYLHQHITKKQIQKSLAADSPAPATLSIPDDACHYDSLDPRALTVREMARIQSFPDNFVFRSKETTGGNNRKFETPQYTQVGNAVPPLLGLALGKVITKLIKMTK